MKDIIIVGCALEWDDQKNAQNIEKHGISFYTAAYVFTDEHRVELLDDRHSDSEWRFAVIGLIEKLLYVVFTERGEVTRLISARLATPQEEEIYNEYNKGLHQSGR